MENFTANLNDFYFFVKIVCGIYLKTRRFQTNGSLNKRDKSLLNSFWRR